MKKHFVYLVFILSFNYTFGCKCAPTDFANEVKSSELVFKGKVHKILKGENEQKIVFIPDKVWKGKQQDTYILSTGLDQASCELKTKEGESYIVFSSNNSVNICSRTRIAKKIDEVKLNFLFSELDQADSINSAENEYLKAITKSKKSFQNKKIIFTLNHKITTKSDWHKSTFGYDEPTIQLLELNEKEKQIYNIDYIFVTWSKQEANDKIKYKILKQIK
jgi:hypothetical protein